MEVPTEETYDPKFAGKPPPKHKHVSHIVTEHAGEKTLASAAAPPAPRADDAHLQEQPKILSQRLQNQDFAARSDRSIQATQQIQTADNAHLGNPFSVIWIAICVALFAVLALVVRRFKKRNKKKLRMSV